MRPELGLDNVERLGPGGEDDAEFGILANVEPTSKQKRRRRGTFWYLLVFRVSPAKASSL